MAKVVDDKQSPQDEWLQHPTLGVPRESFSPAPQPSPGGARQTSASAPASPAKGGAQKGAAPGGKAGAPPKTLIIITASGATKLLVGSSERFKVTLDGKDVTGQVTWTPSDPGISISSMGYADIKAAPGKVTITATHAATGATGSITVTVVERILKKITISPRDPMFEVDKFEPLRAKGEFSDNTFEDVTMKVVWESRNEKVAHMESDGHCVTKAPGKADIWASDPEAEVIDTIKLTVNAAGKAPKLVRLNVTPIDPTVSGFEPLQFTAMGDFADKSTHEVTDSVRWVSDKPDILAINERTGLATPGLIPDTAWVTAVDDATAVHARSEVTVKVPKLESIQIAPRDPSLHKGDTMDVTVMGTFSDGTTKDVTDKVTWSSNDRAVAAVAPLLKQTVAVKEGPPVEIGATVPNFPDVGDSVTVLPAI